MLCYSYMLHALHYHSSGFFIITSTAEGLHFSALVLFVCLFVIGFSTHLDAAFTAWIAFTQQYLGLNSGRFLC